MASMRAEAMADELLLGEAAEKRAGEALDKAEGVKRLKPACEFDERLMEAASAAVEVSDRRNGEVKNVGCEGGIVLRDEEAAAEVLDAGESANGSDDDDDEGGVYSEVDEEFEGSDDDAASDSDEDDDSSDYEDDGRVSPPPDRKGKGIVLDKGKGKAVDSKGKGKAITKDYKGKGKAVIEEEDNSSDESVEEGVEFDEENLLEDPLAEVDLNNILPTRTRRRQLQPVQCNFENGSSEEDEDYVAGANAD